MATFESIFPTFILKCDQLHELLQLVAYMLFIVGTICFVLHGFSAKTLLRHFIRLLILTALLVNLPNWGNQVQSLLQNSILSGLGVDPANVYQQYNAMLVVQRDAGNTHSWWDILGDMGAFTIEALITGVLWLLGHFASLLLFWAYVFQKFVLFSGYAVSPLLLGFMAIPELRSAGTRYLTHLLGVLLWPLGWAVAALITQGILDFMTDPSLRFIDPTSTLYTAQATFGLAVVAFWIVFSTVSAPLMIQNVVGSGVLAGAQLIGGAVNTVFQTAETAVRTASVFSPAGIPVATASATVASALFTTVSTAAGQGSAGSILSAGSGLPFRRNRQGRLHDLTGDQAVRKMIAQSRGDLN